MRLCRDDILSEIKFMPKSLKRALVREFARNLNIRHPNLTGANPEGARFFGLVTAVACFLPHRPFNFVRADARFVL